VVAYFEAHIEQGPILDDTETTIGVIHGALGHRWVDVAFTGQDSHAGPTPMDLRNAEDATLRAIADDLERTTRKIAAESRVAENLNQPQRDGECPARRPRGRVRCAAPRGARARRSFVKG
jgi:acetylornithine deacetylase/succinyl-diaminopimelate desuccinylase-like protein